ncbi:MAG: hypothetical protein J0G30_04380 [Actinomycetales bacterium]|nr:hypothetical protein [Actinomycetales bacterium]
MTIPKWLLPVLGLVVAGAVGVAAAVLGFGFATPRTNEVPVATGTEESPVYAPSAVGDDADPAELASLPLGSLGGSPETGSGTVATELPGDPGVTPLGAATEEAAAGTDAGAGLSVIGDDSADPADGAGGAAGGDGAGPAEDPCIGAGDCPEGTVEGRIYALVAPPAFEMRAVPFVAGVWCPAGAAGTVTVGVMTTRPATVDAGVVRSDGTGAPGRYHVETPADQTAAWDAALAAADEGTRVPFLVQCFDVEILDPDADLFATVTARDREGDVLTRNFEFRGSGPTHHPTLTITPVGDGAAVVSGEHRDDEQLAVRAWVIPGDAAAEPSCFSSRLEDYPELDWQYRSFGDVSEEEASRLRLDTGTSRRTAFGFAVPEGSDILFCGAWFNGEGHPSWERADATYTDGGLLQTTDYVLPQVSLARVDLAPGVDAAALRVTGATAEGMRCGGLDLDPTDPTALPRDVCTLGGASTDFDAAAWSFLDVGFSGDVVIRSALTLDGASEPSTAIGTLDLGRFSCPGGCRTNPTMRFTLPLPRTADGHEAGTMTLVVGWEQGASNGRSRPVVTSVDDSVEIAAGDLPAWAPQMDTDQRIVFDGVDSGSLSGTATLLLVTDRPVDYTVSLEGVRGDTCRVGDAPLATSGHSDAGSADVRVTGLCFGAYYFATVHLVDADGRESTFSATASGRSRWLASFVRIPTVDVRVDWSVSATVASGEEAILAAHATLDGTALPFGEPGCVSGTYGDHGSTVVSLGSHPVLDVYLATSPVTGSDCTASRDDAVVRANDAVELDLNRMRLATGGTVIDIGGVHVVLVVLA